MAVGSANYAHSCYAAKFAAYAARWCSAVSMRARRLLIISFVSRRQPLGHGGHARSKIVRQVAVSARNLQTSLISISSTGHAMNTSLGHFVQHDMWYRRVFLVGRKSSARGRWGYEYQKTSKICYSRASQATKSPLEG